MRLLFAEDEPAMAEAVEDILTYHHYMVDTVDNGIDALEYGLTGQYDGIILDIMMPGMNGMEVLKSLRKQRIGTPILMLTAKAEIEDRIEGLDYGADDYLTKPFAMGEFLARVRAMLRRREEYTPDIVKLGKITLDRRSCTVTDGEHSFLLSKIEFQMMELFMLNPGISFSSEKILEKVWGYDTDAEVGIVWVYISYLRKKLAALGGGIEIRSKRNIGYYMEVTV